MARETPEKFEPCDHSRAVSKVEGNYVTKEGDRERLVSITYRCSLCGKTLFEMPFSRGCGQTIDWSQGIDK